MRDQNSNISTLQSMGFDEYRSRRALESTNGDINLAVAVLLADDDGISETANNTTQQHQRSPPTNFNNTFTAAAAYHPDSSSSSSSPPPPPPPILVQTSLCQYNLPNGRSACTCIAISTAASFLHSVSSTTTTASTITATPRTPEQLITPTFLERSLHTGIALYNRGTNGGGTRWDPSNAVHLSPEDVLDTRTDSNTDGVRWPGGIRQGIVSHDPTSPLNFHAMLTAVRSTGGGGADGERWTAVVVTKTPESICVFLPPLRPTAPSTADGGDEAAPMLWAVVDSHPRPEKGISGSYARFHGGMDGLVRDLEEIFPAVDFGGDVAEGMAVMYNSFDLYPLQMVGDGDGDGDGDGGGDGGG